MGAVTARGRNGDSVGVVPISGRPGDGVVIVRMYTFHASVVVIGIVPAIRRVRGFRRLIPGNTMIVVSCRATACTVSMIRQLIDSPLSCPQPLVDHLVWHTVFVVLVSPGGTDSHSMGMVAVRGCSAGWVVPVGPRRTCMSSGTIVNAIRVLLVIAETAMIMISVGGYRSTMSMARHFIDSD